MAEVLNFSRCQPCGWPPSDKRFFLFYARLFGSDSQAGKVEFLRFLLSISFGRFQVARVTAILIEFRFASKTRIYGTLVGNCDDCKILLR